MELWLKRYMSLFFDFENFGILNLLAILLFIYFLATIKKRKRWEMALVFVFILSCFSLEIKGGFWPRYVLTLYPFTLAAIFLLGWEFIKKRNPRLQLSILIICTIAVLFNFYHFRETYKFYWRYKVIAVDDYFPHDLLKFINNIEDLNSDSTFLVCSQRSLFHYYTNKKGIDYRGPEIRIFKIQNNKKVALDILKNELKINYIYLHREYKTNSILMDIISNDCHLVYQDTKNGFYLYRIREKEPDKKELERLFVNDSFLRNGSLENWSHGPSKKPDFFEGGDNVFDDMVIREEKEVRAGKYAAKITGDNFNFAQDLPNHEDYKGKDLTFFTWVKTTVPDKYGIEIYDGIGHVFSKRRHSGSGDWELLQVNFKVNPLSKFVTIRIIQAEKTGKVDDIVYVDGALAVEGDWNTFYLYKLHMNEVENLFVNNSLLRNGSLENWSHGPSKKPDFFEGGDNVFDDMVIREEKEVRAGKYAAKITGDNFNFAQDLSNHEDYKGKDLTFFTWIKTNVPDKYGIEIYDGIGHVFSKRRHSGSGDWELLQANYTVNPLAEFVTVRIVQAEKTGKVDDVVYVDGALAVEGDWNTFYLYALHTINEKN